MYKNCYCHVCECNYEPSNETFQYEGTDTGICADCLSSVDPIELIETATTYIKDMYVLTPLRFGE
jgi:hypothetical protein